MMTRVFARLMAAFLAVIAAGGAALMFLQSSEFSRRTLLWASLTAGVVALALAVLLAHAISERLRRMVGFAEEIAGGNFSARLSDKSADEIGKLATSLDKTAVQLEQSFAALENSRAQLERLLNSLQDPVIAVSSESKVDRKSVV